jgi:hypothetical protein
LSKKNNGEITGSLQALAARPAFGAMHVVLVGATIGLVLAGIAAARVEISQQLLQPKWTERAAPGNFRGPDRPTAAMRATVGGEWLTIGSALRPPVKIGIVEADPLQGSGFSSARGGTGSEWGPVALTEPTSLPLGAFAGLNNPIERMPRFNGSPLTYAPTDAARTAFFQTDEAFAIRAVPPTTLRRDKGDD